MVKKVVKASPPVQTDKLKKKKPVSKSGGCTKKGQMFEFYSSSRSCNLLNLNVKKFRYPKIGSTQGVKHDVQTHSFKGTLQKFDPPRFRLNPSLPNSHEIDV